MYSGTAVASSDATTRSNWEYGSSGGVSDSKYSESSTSSSGLPFAPTSSGVAAARAVSASELRSSSTRSPAGSASTTVIEPTSTAVFSRWCTR